MNLPTDILIEDSRRFQKHGQYDDAISCLNKARMQNYDNTYTVEIEKLLSFNYRKLENFDLALYHINNAINAIPLLTNEEKNNRAICLMNKGIIYEERNSVDQALLSYLEALNIFLALHDPNGENNGIIINALITISLLYDKQGKYKKEIEYLQQALEYFGTGKENDRRYVSIINTLSELKNK